MPNYCYQVNWDDLQITWGRGRERGCGTEQELLERCSCDNATGGGEVALPHPRQVSTTLDRSREIHRSAARHGCTTSWRAGWIDLSAGSAYVGASLPPSANAYSRDNTELVLNKRTRPTHVSVRSSSYRVSDSFSTHLLSPSLTPCPCHRASGLTFCELLPSEIPW